MFLFIRIIKSFLCQLDDQQEEGNQDMTTTNRAGHKINRRRFLQIIGIAGAATAGWKFGLFGTTRPLQVAHASLPIMGTVMNISLYGPDREACQEALQQTTALMRGLEGQLSRHQPDSEVATLNRHGSLTAANPDLLQVLHLATGLSRKTDGAFDITVLPLLRYQQEVLTGSAADPDRHHSAHALIGYGGLRVDRDSVSFASPGMGISLDGIGKGYIVDLGVASLRQKGFANLYVEAGGDLMVTGNKEGRVPWRIGLRPPRPQSGRPLVTLAVSDRAVATSGDYLQAFTADLREHHIIDPRSGFSPPELASCTVTAPNVAIADGLATALMVLGRQAALDLIESLPDCEAYLVDKALQPSHTSGFFS